MKLETLERLKRDLIRDEGLRLEPYRCPAGKLTIGVERNLDDRGITEAEAFMMLNNNVALVHAGLNRALPWWWELSEEQQLALANMAFNLGTLALLNFRRMLAAMKAGGGQGRSVREALNSQ